jgi:hypothetical protein
VLKFFYSSPVAGRSYVMKYKNGGRNKMRKFYEEEEEGVRHSVEQRHF